MISFIVAMDDDYLIGTEEGLPWHLSADLKRFRRLTMGKPIVMGRTTHEMIGRPLDGRKNIILTRNPDYRSEGCVICHSLDEALTKAGDAEVMIIGGRQIYLEAMPRCQKLYLTLVNGSHEGTIYFPVEELLSSSWRITEEERYEDHRFLIAEPGSAEDELRRALEHAGDVS